MSDIQPRGTMPQGLTNLDLDNLRIPRLQLMQGTSQIENVQPGKWFFTLVDEIQDSVACRFLTVIQSRMKMPSEEQGLGRPICFSIDMVAPHPHAQIPQSEFCESCYYNKREGGKLPGCGKVYIALGVREGDDMPFWIYFRSSAATVFHKFISGFLMKTRGQIPLYAARISLTSWQRKGERGSYYVPVINATLATVTPELEDLYDKYIGLSPFGDHEESHSE